MQQLGHGDVNNYISQSVKDKGSISFNGTISLFVCLYRKQNIELAESLFTPKLLDFAATAPQAPLIHSAIPQERPLHNPEVVRQEVLPVLEINCG